MSEPLECKRETPAYMGTLRKMPVGQLLYIKKSNKGFSVDYLCEFVGIDPRGNVVGKVIANHSAYSHLRSKDVGLEIKARSNCCFLFLRGGQSWPSCRWFPSLDAPALKGL